MREIKFRGKDVDKRIGWHYGFYFKDGNKTYISENGRTYEVDPETVGQYIGLPDKNKVEIYEGDIVRDKIFNYKTKKLQKRWRIFIVYWDEETASFWQKLVKLPEDCLRFGILDHNYAAEKECEVIGNKSDNPELLESK